MKMNLASFFVAAFIHLWLRLYSRTYYEAEKDMKFIYACGFGFE